MMKFALALLAIGSQAVKLHFDIDSEWTWEERAENIHSVVDWDGSGTVDAEEIRDVLLIADVLGYISDEEYDEMYDFAGEVVELLGGPFTHEELVDGVHWVLESGDSEDFENLEKLEGLMEGAEEMLVDLAIDIAFDMVDTNGNDAIEVEEVDDMIYHLELDDEEA